MTKQRLLFATNRFNAVGVLTRGVIAPVEAYSKYYPDLLEFAPGYVPLLADGISASAATSLEDSESISFPVLVDVGLSEAPTGSLTLEHAGKEFGVAIPGLVAAPAGRVIFRSESDASEFRARRYGNVDLSDIAWDIEPSAFDAKDAPDFASIESHLRALPDRVTDPITIDLVDGFAGAVVIAMASATTSSTADAASSGAGMLASATSAVEIEAAMLTFLSGLGGLEEHESDLLRIVVESLVARPDESRDAPITALDSILERLAGDPEDPIVVNLRRVGQILAGEAPLERFRPTGVVTAKALLLYLLQPEPEDVLKWIGADTAASDKVLSLAAALSGLARRYRGLPGHLRGTEKLHAMISALIGDATNAALESPIPRSMPSPPRITTTVTDAAPGFVKTTFKMGRTQLMLNEHLDPGVRGELLRLTLDVPASEQSALAVVDALGWTDVLIHSFKARSARISIVAGEILIEVTGKPDQWRRVDVERFRERVRNLGSKELDSVSEVLRRAVLIPEEGDTPVARANAIAT